MLNTYCAPETKGASISGGMHHHEAQGDVHDSDDIRAWQPLLPPTVRRTAGETPSVGAVSMIAWKVDKLIGSA